MTVAELLARASSQELAEWQAFFTLENEEMDMQKLRHKSRAEAKQRILK